MKKTALLNQPLSHAIAGLGHTDTLVICDAGLPIPATGPQRIDLAVTAGLPSFVDVLKTVLQEMQVEKAIIASEITAKNPAVHSALLEALGDTPVELIPHEDFKARTQAAKAITRTGECSPYANVILVSGVTF